MFSVQSNSLNVAHVQIVYCFQFCFGIQYMWHEYYWHRQLYHKFCRKQLWSYDTEKIAVDDHIFVERIGHINGNQNQHNKQSRTTNKQFIQVLICRRNSWFDRLVSHPHYIWTIEMFIEWRRRQILYSRWVKITNRIVVRDITWFCIGCVVVAFNRI